MAVAVQHLGLMGCGPEAAPSFAAEAERYSAAICDAVEACGCATPFESHAACRDDLYERFEDLANASLRVDSRCFEQSIDAVDACGTFDTPLDDCPVVRGRKAEGERCSQHEDLPAIDVNECDDGLLCRGQRCWRPDAIPPAPLLEVGAACSLVDSVACGVGPVFCDESAHCSAQVGVDEPCSAALQCNTLDDPILYCEGLNVGEGHCRPPRAVGEPCDPLDHFSCGVDECDPLLGVCVTDGSVAELCTAIVGPQIFPR